MQPLRKKISPFFQSIYLAFSQKACYNASMKRTDTQKNGKVFPFRHNTLSVVFCIFALLLCAIGAGLSVYRIVSEGVEEFSDVLQSPFLIAICLFCAAVIISILVKSEFVVTNEALVTRFGFIKSTLPLATVSKMEHDRTTHKLTVYCGEEFTVFTLKPEWADELVHEICTANPNIEFLFTMTENKPPKDDNKKGKAKKNNKDNKQ